MESGSFTQHICSHLRERRSVWGLSSWGKKNEVPAYFWEKVGAAESCRQLEGTEETTVRVLACSSSHQERMGAWLGDEDVVGEPGTEETRFCWAWGAGDSSHVPSLLSASALLCRTVRTDPGPWYRVLGCATQTASGRRTRCAASLTHPTHGHQAGQGQQRLWGQLPVCP